jgi:hypothetical protein
MESSDLAELTTDSIQKLGLSFYFDPLTAERAKELGMNVFEFYGLGRGGVLGDVDVEVVDRAFTFFHPRTMDFLFHRARAKACYLQDDSVFKLHGYGDDDVPPVTPELEAKKIQGEVVTSRLMAPYYSVLSGDERQRLADGTLAMFAALSDPVAVTG